MEKRTIGKFIQALRRAQGMTQRELAERLYVSDKTVSRWECDECTPELSLIPAIAEIFGITTDELLRGERKSADRPETDGEDASRRLRQKSEKQFKTMLRRRMTRYKNFSMLSCGLMVAGLLAAFLCNFAFYRGGLAFFLGLAFLVAGAITEICFSSSARLALDEEDEAYQKETEEYNRAVVNHKWHRLGLDYLLLAAILPFILFEGSSYMGLTFGSWLLMALVSLAVALLLLLFARSLLGRSFLERKEGIRVSDKEESLRRANGRSAKKTLAVFAPIFAVLFLLLAILGSLPVSSFTSGETLEDVESFRQYVAEAGKHWTSEKYGVSVPISTTPADVTDEEPEEDPNKDHENFYDVEALYDGYGNFVCYYDSYFNFIMRMEFSGNDLFPITVYTAEHYVKAGALQEVLLSTLGVLLVADLVAGCLTYAYLANQNRKKAIV